MNDVLGLRNRGSIVVTSLALLAATLFGAAGIAADAPGASAAQVTRTGLRYLCRFPAGWFGVSVEVTSAVTPTAQTGSQIQPTAVHLAAQVPPAAEVGLPGRATATGTLTVIETSHGQSVEAAWPVTDPHPASGTLLLGVAPPAVVTSTSGLVTFAASRLDLVLRAGPEHARVDCSAVRPARFAAVTVIGSSARPARRSGIPRQCGDIKVTGSGVATCAYVTGYSDVAKLIGAALLQPRSPAKQGLVNVAFAEKAITTPKLLIEKSAAELFYRGHHELPPITATLLAFGFVPVSATLHLTELTVITIVSVSGRVAPPYPITVTSKTKIALSVTNVRVNGVPLNVGASCRTATPITLVLIGKGQNLPPEGYTVPSGGALTGDATIPPFTGCGVTENLDPLLTGSISGRGNFVRFIQAPLCAPSQPSLYACPPPAAKPSR